MDLQAELIMLSTELAKIIGQKSVESIFDKVRTAKSKSSKEETISSLEEIINDLIADKNSLIQISQAYEESLITQKISTNEIEYITDSVIPLLEELIYQSNNDDAEKVKEWISILKSIVSKETFTIMQMLGFNFKKAIGEPLTELISSLIRAKIANTTDKALDAQILLQQREIEYLKICQDEEAFNRMTRLNPKFE